MILSISGASGAGKSSLAKELLTLLPNANMSPGWSTRPMRSSETASDVRHVSFETFGEMRARDEFLWALEVHGNWYGTLRQTIVEGLTSKQSWTIIALVPDVLQILTDFADGLGRRKALKLLYVLSPEPEALRARLSTRESNADVIARRLVDCARWDETASASDLYDLFAQGYGDLSENSRRVVRQLGYPESTSPDVKISAGSTIAPSAAIIFQKLAGEAARHLRPSGRGGAVADLLRRLATLCGDMSLTAPQLLEAYLILGVPQGGDDQPTTARRATCRELAACPSLSSSPSTGDISSAVLAVWATIAERYDEPNIDRAAAVRERAAREHDTMVAYRLASSSS